MPFIRRTRKKFGRKARSVARPVRRGLRSRYVPKNRRGKRSANIGQIMSDVAYLKRQLNTEWKVTDPSVTTYGFDTLAPPLIPTKSTPSLVALDYPSTIGTSGVGDRIGKKVKIVNLHLRWRLDLDYDSTSIALSNPTTNVHYKIYVIWEKRTDNHSINPADQVLRLWKDDPAGNKSYISQFNELEYKDFLITYKQKGQISPLQANEGILNVRNRRYMEHNIPLSIHQEFDDANQLTMNRPWLVIMTDNDNNTQEHIKFSLVYKMSYVDN